MMSETAPSSSRTVFKRKHVQLSALRSNSVSEVPGIPRRIEPVNAAWSPPLVTSASSEETTILVINSSHEMAKEISMQLTLALPGCSFMYAPTIEVAKWILSRRKIGLVVASPLLPDGNISRLRPILEKMQNPPDFVVVGTVASDTRNLMASGLYEWAGSRKLGSLPNVNVSAPVAPKIVRRERSQRLFSIREKTHEQVRVLGADIRNDLNNPLQEIVAMVFVAQAGIEASPTTLQALNAIENAAQSMSRIVNALEDKIRTVVQTTPAS